MKQLSILCVALCLGMLGGQALAASPGGGTGSPVAARGALGTSADRPGTNSLGTALPSSDRGNGRRHKGAPLGTGPDMRRANRRADHAIHSICRGC